MISKRSFTMLLKDDLKKRSWLLVMSFLVFCLIFPGVILDNIQGMISIYGETDLSPRFLNALTYSGNNYYALAVVLMAAICALTGFSYIYSRPKLDFYHSLPVKRETWLLLKAASGLVIFAGATGAAAIEELFMGAIYHVADLNLAVVMPTTHLAWYSDTQYGYRYWEYISHELPEICRSFFRGMSDRREDTFAAGLSMGGYGAFKLGLRASDTFSAAASLSGGLDIVDIINAERHVGNQPLWRGILGDPASVPGSDNDLFALSEKLKASGKPLPKLFMWCGTEDFLYQQNLKMRDHLNGLGYDLTYRETPGDHQWCYWDREIQNVLKWLPIQENQ